MEQQVGVANNRRAAETS